MRDDDTLYAAPNEEDDEEELDDEDEDEDDEDDEDEDEPEDDEDDEDPSDGLVDFTDELEDAIASSVGDVDDVEILPGGKSLLVKMIDGVKYRVTVEEV